MDKDSIEKMDSPTDPHRCQSASTQGQCDHKGVILNQEAYAAGTEPPNYGTFCMLHGGNKQIESSQANSLRQYRLTRWQSRLQEFSDSSILKSLREEIGILRILLEERLNFCKDTNDLILTSGPISDLVLKIERVVTSCHKLESRMGQHLDKAAVIQLAGRFVQVISSELADQPERIDSISSKLLDIIKEEQNEDF